MIKATDTRCGSDDGDNCDTYNPIVIEKGGQAATSIGILKINEMVSVYDINDENDCEPIELSLHKSNDNMFCIYFRF